MLIQQPTGLELRTLESQATTLTTKPTPGLDIEGRENNILSFHDRKKLVVVHFGAIDSGKVYSEVLKNRYRILGKRLKAKGCEGMFSGIIPRLGNNIEIMSRAIDVNQWLEEWCMEEGFTFRKQWESFRGQRVCFRNDGQMLHRKGATIRSGN